MRDNAQVYQTSDQSTRFGIHAGSKLQLLFRAESKWQLLLRAEIKWQLLLRAEIK
jgi:hypothetical protein